ncbi:EAL domain-containing protein [Roseateles asaccharophilus]|uniref:Diguanylate cyclase (GGDEF)-like protein/PAS domain S-box-containing protein n=1 Tax=Roseateles asaccharophilus TaxID=582607 RepID=A0ABU2A2X3_9BURK|nr:EAL domain-containing protein [Roseateles asaccharophilus]MDR7331536.1 diguanylate cyclase (GGDEF)-like protein/PAS domain S-box-containing protein [Roseateles asaccharophilus]
MDLLSGAGDGPDARAAAHGLTTHTPPPSTLPGGPPRIHDRRGWRRLRRVGLAGLAGLAGGLVIAWVLAGPALPIWLRLPQPAQALPAAQLLLPLLISGLGLAALWRLSAWVLPLTMAGLLLGCGLPLLPQWAGRPAALLAAMPLLSVLALPVLALLLRRGLLRRLGLSGQLARRREIVSFGLLAGVAAPLLTALPAAVLLQSLGLGWRGALPLAVAWALGLVSVGTALQASSQRPRRSSRWTAPGLATAAVLAQLALIWPAASGLLLLPHLLLCLHALQASPRDNARLGVGLLVLWALMAAGTPLDFGCGALLAMLPLAIIGVSRHHLRERDAWRAALDAQGLALAEWRLPEGRRQASARWLSLTTPLEPTAAAGSGPLDWVRIAHPRDREAARAALRDLLGSRARDQLSLSLRLAADGGDWRWHELQAHVPQRDRRGHARNLILTLADVSWRHTAEERERMSATLFQQSGEGLAVIDAHWRILEVNPAYCEIMHASRETLVGRIAAPLASANLKRSGLEAGELQTHLNGGEPWNGRLQVELDDGGRHVFQVRLSAVPEPDGIAPRWRLLSLTDLGESLRQQEMLRRSQRYDMATGLPNRDEFMRLLPQAMSAANRDDFKLVVAVIDLDDFARVNAEHGQLVADAIIRQLSERLQATLRGARGAWPDTSDHLARLHGDEFAVLLRVQTPEEAQRAIDRLLAVLSTPVAIRESRIGDGLALEIGASVGATLYPKDDAAPETLLRHAGHALFRAKRSGRGSVHFHDPTVDQRDEVGLIAVARLQRALDSDELLLHYQPQVDLRNGQVMGVEALLRWQHPERGLLTPALFLPASENSGLAVQIGDWVIEQALTQAALWQRSGLNEGRGLQVSVNVAARQLNQPDFPQRLQELIQRQPPELAHLLHLDVLEADALAETAATQALIQRCLSLGVGIALDDFGAGYSRLTSLKQLPVDTLKMDRSYVQGMLGDAQDLSLVEGVIGLARNIGCSVLAKGVESRAHARELLRLGCRLGQGNGIAAAMPPAAIPGWMQAFGRSGWTAQLRLPTHARP